MSNIPQPIKVTLEGTSSGKVGTYHMRFRDPSEFTEIRTPYWARHAASKMAIDKYDYSGPEESINVRTGYMPKYGKWGIQVILIPAEYVRSELEAKAIAANIFQELDHISDHE